MKRICAVLAVIVLASPSLAGAQAAPGSAPAVPGAASAPTPDVPNLRFDVAILDEGGGAPPTRKNVSIIARGNNQTASVRSEGTLNSTHPISIAMRAQSINIGLKVDVRGMHSQWMPSALPSGKIAGRVAVEYQPYSPEVKSLPSSVTTQVDAVFDEGRKMVIAQAADPLSDRRTTIEVTVTVLK
jgi:hypothetical protein